MDENWRFALPQPRFTASSLEVHGLHASHARMELNRRGFIAATAALAAWPNAARAETDRLVATAKRELERLGNRVWLKDKVAIADFSAPSRDPRFAILDMTNGTTTRFLVAHGRGSDPDHLGWLQSFSNSYGSLATSRGAYLTHTWYNGKYGTSMRLTGLDRDNSEAEARAIVVHGAWYANPAMIDEWGKLGRSEGCFAVPEDSLLEFIGRLGPGRLLFADKL